MKGIDYDWLSDQFDKEPNDIQDKKSYFAGYEKAIKNTVALLEKQLKMAQDEIKEANIYLDSFKVPSNGVDANGKLGWGKRENLSLHQRLTYLTPHTHER